MIIGLSGYARSGKDTVAGMLMGIHHYEQRAFANKIRELLFAIDPLIMHDGKDFRLQDIVESKGWEDAKTQHPEVRRLLQDLGVGARTLFGDDFWIYQVLKDIHPSDKIVISDVRFKNEAECISARGGQVWRINRVGVEAANQHISEHDLDDWKFDGVITNNSDMPNLIKQIRALLG
jgi:hypothetical protein